MGGVRDCSHYREDLMQLGDSRPLVIAGIYLSAGYLGSGQDNLRAVSRQKGGGVNGVIE